MSHDYLQFPYMLETPYKESTSRVTQYSATPSHDHTLHSSFHHSPARVPHWLSPRLVPTQVSYEDVFESSGLFDLYPDWLAAELSKDTMDFGNETTQSFRSESSQGDFPESQPMLDYDSNAISPPFVSPRFCSAILDSPTTTISPMAHSASEHKRRSSSSYPVAPACNGGHHRRKAVQKTQSVTARKLACPYFKSDPIGHIQCIKIERQNLRGVKEHLKRNHQQERPGSPVLVKMRNWPELFRGCFPDWRGPVPPEHFDHAEIGRVVTTQREAGTNGTRYWEDYQHGHPEQAPFSPESRYPESFSWSRDEGWV